MTLHLQTPEKSEIRGARKILEFLAREGKYDEPRKLATLAECFQISENRVSTIYRSLRNRRRYSKGEDPRGGYRGDDILRLGEENISGAIYVIEDNDYEGHDLDYGALRYEATLPDVSNRTIRRSLRKEGIGRYIARTEDELDYTYTQSRIKFALEQLEIRPKSIDWRNVLFTDEFYFGQGQEENRHYIFRRLGQRNKLECIRRVSKKKTGRKKGPKRDENPRNDEETKDVHFFAIIGYDFKKFIEYKPRNSNGKMSSRQYIDEFLIPEILPLIKARPDLILEEDLDGSYTSREVIKFKRENNISYYLNARSSPDLSVVETIAGISKNSFRRRARFTREDVRAEALRSFDSITLNQINNSVDSMPARLHAVIDNKGQKTQY